MVLFAFRRLTACRSATAGQSPATLAPLRGTGRKQRYLREVRHVHFEATEGGVMMSHLHTLEARSGTRNRWMTRRLLLFPGALSPHCRRDRKPVFWVRLTLYTHHTVQTASLAQEPFSRHGEKDQLSHHVAGSATSAPSQPFIGRDLCTRQSPQRRYWWQDAH